MKKTKFNQLEAILGNYAQDGAHDVLHTQRVLYIALEIAKEEHGVDLDVLIAACLLHDIGREMQNKNPVLCHAEEGSKLARKHLAELGWENKKIEHIANCILTHRFRNGEPQSIEAKILFDADKVDVSGALGTAKILFVKGELHEDIYSLADLEDKYRNSGKDNDTFFQEYNYCLKNLEQKFYTKTARRLAADWNKAAHVFYDELFEQVKTIHGYGVNLKEYID